MNYHYLQQIIQKSADESAEFVLKETLKMEEEGVNGVKKLGMKVYTLSPQERRVFKNAATPVTNRWIKKHGNTAKELIEFVEKIQ